MTLDNPTKVQRYDWKTPFLRQLRKHGRAVDACREVGISQRHAYAVRREQPKFAQRWTEAVVEAKRRRIARYEKTLEHVATGYRDPVFQGGVLVGHKTKYSVTALLAGLQSETKKYRKHQQQATVQSISISVDARQAFLRDPLVMERALALDEALALSRASSTAPAIDVSPDASAGAERCEIASSDQPAEQPTLSMHAPIEQPVGEASVLQKSIIAPIVPKREVRRNHPKRGTESPVQVAPGDDWADEPWDD